MVKFQVSMNHNGRYFYFEWGNFQNPLIHRKKILTDTSIHVSEAVCLVWNLGMESDFVAETASNGEFGI